MTEDPCGCERVCSLAPDELQARVASLRAELFPLARSRQRLSDGIAWEFDTGTAMRARLERFVEFERQCCGGVTFGIDESSGTGRLRLTVRGPDAAAFAALGGVAAEVREDAVTGGGVGRLAKAGTVGIVASLFVCCGLPLAVAVVVGSAVAVPLARFDNPLTISLSAVVIAVLSWVAMQRRSKAAGRCEDC